MFKSIWIWTGWCCEKVECTSPWNSNNRTAFILFSPYFHILTALKWAGAVQNKYFVCELFDFYLNLNMFWTQQWREVMWWCQQTNSSLSKRVASAGRLFQTIRTSKPADAKVQEMMAEEIKSKKKHEMIRQSWWNLICYLLWHVYDTEFWL